MVMDAQRFVITQGICIYIWFIITRIEMAILIFCFLSNMILFNLISNVQVALLDLTYKRDLRD